MKHLLKIITLIVTTIFLAQSVSGYDPSKHQKGKGGKSGGKGHHSYGRHKG